MNQYNKNFILNYLSKELTKTVSVEYFATSSVIISDLEYVKELARKIDENLLIEFYFSNGELVSANEAIFRMQGLSTSMLEIERNIINQLQISFSLSSKINSIIERIKKYQTKLIIIPNDNSHSAAIINGGAITFDHVFKNLIYVKHNHKVIFTDLYQLRNEYKNNNAKLAKIALEVESLEQFKEANIIGFDIIILKSMTIELMEICVNLSKNKHILMATGDIDLDKIENLAKIGLDYIIIESIKLLQKTIDLDLKYII